MAEIYFIRHGQTDMNIHHMLQGRTDTHLNETGREMARGARDFLTKEGIRPDVILTSPLDRVKETLEIATGQDRSSFHEDPLLIEFGFGPYEGVPSPELPPDFYHSFFENPDTCVMPEGAETYPEIVDRAGRFLKKVLEEFPAGDERTVLCGTHGGFLHALFVAAGHRPLHDFWEVAVRNCSVYHLRYPEDGKCAGDKPDAKDGIYVPIDRIFEGYGDTFQRGVTKRQ